MARKTAIARIGLVFQMRHQGATFKAIGRQLGVTPDYVSRIYHRSIAADPFQSFSFGSSAGDTGKLHPCWLEKKAWPTCAHGEHCYLSGRCAAWAAYKLKSQPEVQHDVCQKN
mgnify:CR=1 FL=1